MSSGGVSRGNLQTLTEKVNELHLAYLEKQRELEVLQTQWQIKEESRQSQLDMIKLENKSLKETNELIKRESETLRESFEQSRRSAAVSSLQHDECLVKQEMLI